MFDSILSVEAHIIKRLQVLFICNKQYLPLNTLLYEIGDTPLFILEKAIKNLIKNNKITVVNDYDVSSNSNTILLFLANQKYESYCIKTSKNKIPCKDCPYRIGQIENFELLNTSVSEYNGSIVHDCHKLSKDYTLEGDGLGCVGSSWFGMKINNVLNFSELKELEEMIYPKQ